MTGVTEQDAKIAGEAHEAGKGIIIAVNKWDEYEKDTNTVEKYKIEVYNNHSDSLATGKDVKVTDTFNEGTVTSIKVGNSAGRRMEHSLVGNFNPTGEPQELDEAKMKVIVNPPTGSTLVYVIISVIVVVAAAIIITGGVFIKKKVLNK